MSLEVLDRIEHTDTGTVTLVIGDPEDPNDLGALYHYAAEPPTHAKLSADAWDQQTRAHALALEARSRGVELPAEASSHDVGRAPQQLGAGSDEPLADDDRAELEQLRAQRAARDQGARDRAELEQLRQEARGPQA